MNEPLAFGAGLRGRVLENEPMSRHVSWRAGGPARRAYVPRDLEDLCALLRALPAGEPLLFVGLGSNLLVRDRGFCGTVVLMHDIHGRPRCEGEEVFAPAGVASPRLARFAAGQGFEGSEFLAGIPGTVGGALAMNAGCFGSETWDVVSRVQTLGRDGALAVHGHQAFEIGYRHCVAQGAAAGMVAFAGAWFRFRRGDGARARQRIRELLERRVATQPIGQPNAGSVFRNPAGDHAARLIESCGLKGFAIGGARVSEKHANFIVNPGGLASAGEIEALIEAVRRRVRETRGVDLVPEVRIVGEA